MKETIDRSPNIVFNVEWTGFTNTPDGFTKRKHDLVDWFVARNFTFYMMNQVGRRDCGPEIMVKKTPEYVKAMYTYTGNYDVFFVPGHMDPNKIV